MEVTQATETVEQVGAYQLTSFWENVNPWDVPEGIPLTKEQEDWLEEQERAILEQLYYSLPDYPDCYRY